MLGKFKKIIKRITRQLFYSKADLIEDIRAQKLTYLSKEALHNISDSIQKIENNKVKGIFIENGCALGGSAILIGKTKNPNRDFKIYDVFDMIPPPTEKDGEDIHQRYDQIKKGESKGIGDNIYYGYEENLLEKIKNNFKKFKLSEKNKIEFIQGLYEDTLKLNEAVAFAHIDCDWYSSVMTCLREIEPNLSQNGILIIDDYYDWSGCKTAVDEYFEDKKDQFDFETVAKKLVITKK